MRNLNPHQHQDGSNPETPSEKLAPNSSEALRRLNEVQILAAKAADRLFDLLPPMDVGDPKQFLTEVIATFAGYPQEVFDKAPRVIAQRSDRPTLKLITGVCDELYEPIARLIARDRANNDHQLLLAAPKKPDDQAQRDVQVMDYETRIKPLLASSIQTIEPERIPQRADGRHFERIKADLDARRARNEAKAQTSASNAA